MGLGRGGDPRGHCPWPNEVSPGGFPCLGVQQMEEEAELLQRNLVTARHQGQVFSSIGSATEPEREDEQPAAQSTQPAGPPAQPWHGLCPHPRATRQNFPPACHRSHGHALTTIQLPARRKTQIPAALGLHSCLRRAAMLLRVLRTLGTTSQAVADPSRGARQVQSSVWGAGPAVAWPAQLSPHRVSARGPDGTRPKRGLTGGRFCGNIFSTKRAQDPSGCSRSRCTLRTGPGDAPQLRIRSWERDRESPPGAARSPAEPRATGSPRAAHPG